MFHKLVQSLLFAKINGLCSVLVYVWAKCNKFKWVQRKCAVYIYSSLNLTKNWLRIVCGSQACNIRRQVCLGSQCSLCFRCIYYMSWWNDIRPLPEWVYKVCKITLPEEYFYTGLIQFLTCDWTVLRLENSNTIRLSTGWLK